MKSVQAMSNPEDDLRFCPSWSAAKKKGRPKKNECIKSVMDHIEESAKKKRKRRVRFFLQYLPKVQPQHSGLLEESKQSIKNYAGQC